MDGSIHSLDFIYGYGTENFFIPLDGQQRLTTLWLLHLYLGCMTGRSERIGKYQFSYETRDSSARFCEKLLKNTEKLLIKDELCKKNRNNRKTTPSTIIKNEGWWFTNWSDDPTISGILTMLDEIDAQFYGSTDNEYPNVDMAGESLFDQDKKPIVFQFMSLSGFHDIDDLYIKMNARGLPLTPFEIFKSKLIEDVEKKLDAKSQKEFKSNIDVTWSDVLWKHKKDGDKNIDNFLERALKLLIANEGTLSSNIKDDSALDNIFEAKGQHLTFAHNWYEKQGIQFNTDLLNRLIGDMSVLFDRNNNLLSTDAVIPDYDSHWFDIVCAIRKWILYGLNIDGQELTYDTRLKLHAYLKYEEAFTDKVSGRLTAWMRLVHNLAEATPIDNSQDMVRALNSVEALLDSYKKSCIPNAISIDKWLKSQEGSAIKFYAAYQWNEEISKAKLRISAPEWAVPIELAEKHSYLNGQIGITLYLAGVYEKASYSSTLNPTITADYYNNWLTKILPLFTEMGNANSETVKQFAMVKAMLVKGDYMPCLSRNRYNFYNRPGDRDYSWKRLFLVSDKPNIEAFKCLKEIINDSNYNATNAQNILKSLQTIGDTYQGNSNWKKILLGEYGASVMQNAKQGFIAFDNENVLIYRASQRNHRHSELQSLALYYELRQNEAQKITINYHEVKSADDDAGFTINGYEVYHWIRTNELPWTIEWMIKNENAQKTKQTRQFSSKEDVLNFIKDTILSD